MELFRNTRYENAIKKGHKGWLTFFTPTYNRSQFLHRIYDGLVKQTNSKFVWIVVNDGSTDDTDHVIKLILHEDKIPILYICKRNGGKHSAFKAAFENCQTDYIMCMDDDDVYSELSVETILNEWALINDETIGAIRTLTKRKDGSYLSNIVINENDYGKRLDVDTLTYNYIYRIKQENWTCYKMSALKQVDIFKSDYWMYEHHKFVTEAIWQGRFARAFKCRYLYIALRTFSTQATESLTRARKTRQRYLDQFLNTVILLNEQLEFRKRNPRKLLYDIIWLTSVRKKLDIPLKEFVLHIDNTILKMVMVVLSPLSLILQSPKVPKD